MKHLSIMSKSPVAKADVGADIVCAVNGVLVQFVELKGGATSPTKGIVEDKCALPGEE